MRMTVSSVEPSSTTITSKLFQVWSKTLSNASIKKAARLYDGMTTETRGGFWKPSAVGSRWIGIEYALHCTFGATTRRPSCHLLHGFYSQAGVEICKYLHTSSKARGQT